MSKLNEWTRGFACAGAALRAAHLAKEKDSYYIQSSTLVITDKLLADKVLSMIMAGQELPDNIDELTFEETSRLHRFIILVVTHMKKDSPLIADHPDFVVD